MIDLCIIGGGAAGMTAAVTAKNLNPNLEIVILEKKEKLGKKILASGNGKCNLSNINCKGYIHILEFFQSMGLITRADEDGRIYPYSEESKAVVSAFWGALKKLGVSVKTGSCVKSVSKTDFFTINFNNGEMLKAKKVIIACGGKSAPKLGSTGDGYRWAKGFGHSVTKLIPALTAVDVSEKVSDLKGVREKAQITLLYKGNEIFREMGEVQFTEKGISGICVFNLSRFLVIPEGKSLSDGFSDYLIKIDFMPGFNQVERLLKERSALGIFDLNSLVKEPLAEYIRKLSGGNIKIQSEMLKSFTLSVTGVKGWDFAQVTRGGVCMDEINLETMESIIIKNLYFIGEVTDFDGPCGGYNLNYAWETGIKAGRNIANV